MATILDLLAALNRGDLPPLPAPAKPVPIPYAPVPNLGPLSTDTTAAFGALNPEPVPPGIAAPRPVDEGFVSQYAGPAPAAPAALSRGQRIANALMGFGAGVQGNGGQFLQQLQEPQRRYEANLRAFNENRRQGTELDLRRAEQDADRANRAAELAYQRDYNIYLKKLGIRKDEADERTRQAFDVYKLDRKAKEDQAQERQREQRQREVDARIRTNQFFTATKNMALSRELGNFYSGLSDKPLSKAAAALDAQLQGVGEARMDRAMRVGGGGAGSGIDKQTAKLVQEFNNARENLITAVARGDAKGQDDFRRRLTSLVKRLAGRPGIEAGYGAGKWPYIKVNGQLQGAAQPGQQQTAQPQAQGKTITRAEMQALGVTEAEVKAEGYTITP